MKLNTKFSKRQMEKLMLQSAIYNGQSTPSSATSPFIWLKKDCAGASVASDQGLPRSSFVSTPNSTSILMRVPPPECLLPRIGFRNDPKIGSGL